MIYVGIDPGKKGGIAAVKVKGERCSLVFCEVVPTFLLVKGKTKRDYDLTMMRLLVENLKKDGIRMWGLERTWGAMRRSEPLPARFDPKRGIWVSVQDQAATAMHAQGEGFGIWRGLLAGLGVPFRLVAPQTWHSKVTRGLPGDTAARATAAAESHFPATDFRSSSRAKKAHSGKTTATCIALYMAYWMKEEG